MSFVSSKTSLSGLFSESIRSAAMHSYPSVYMPQEDVKQPEKISVYRAGEMVEKQLTPSSLASGAIQLLADVKNGVIGKLSSGTGVGKSTRVPLQFAKQLGTVVLMVCPNHQMAQTVGEYVASTLLVGGNGDVVVTVAKSKSDVDRVVAPAVVYMGSSEFWFSIYERRSILKDKGIGVVCFDESHERIPQYVLASFMVTTEVFSAVKVFMMSATASADKLEIRPAGINHTVTKRDPKLLDYEIIGELDASSPLHYSHMTKPTLIFLPSDQWVDVVAEYYESNAVMVMKLRSDDGAAEMKRLNERLTTLNCAAVVLATQMHQTCYTFELCNVIDCGLSLMLFIDEDTGAMSVKEVIVSSSDKVQRCGRVGRHKSGEAVCVASAPRMDDPEIYPSDYMYLSLWAKLFNVSLKAPYLAKWNKVVESLAPTCVRILLAAKLHPWLLINYLTTDGEALSGLKQCFGALLGIKHAVKSSGGVLSEVDASRWLDRSMRPGILPVGLPLDYSVPVEIPLSWSVIAYVLHCGLRGYSLNALLEQNKLSVRNRRASTVVSSAMSALSASSMGTSVVPLEVGSMGKVLPVADLLPSDSVSMVGVNNRSTTRLSGEIRRKGATAVFSSASSVGSLPTYRSKLHGSGIVVRDKEKKYDVVGDMVDELITSDSSLAVAPPRRNVKLDKKTLVKSGELRVLAAADLRLERVRPFNDSHMSVFVRMRSSDDCIAFYRDLKYCRCEIASMSSAQMRDYYVAVITVWNRKVSNRLQHKAAPYTGFMCESRNERFYDKIDLTLRRCRGFLVAFEHHGFVLAELAGHEQVGDECEDLSLYPGGYEAAWVLSMGTDKLRSRVQQLSQVVQRFVRSDGKSGCYVIIGSELRVIRHVVATDCDGVLSVEFPRSDVRKVVLGEIVTAQLTTSSLGSVFTRAAKTDEFVVVVTKDWSNISFTLGVYRVLNVGVLCEYSAKLFSGASGSAVVAVDDGALLGFHYGVVCSDGESVVSSFVPCC